MYCTFSDGIGPQAVPMQTLGETQSALLAQVVLHAVAPQMNGVHIDVVAAWQVPLPLHVRADVAVATLQLGPTHWVPVAYRRQPPEPLQKPSVPQVDDPASVHWFSGSLPVGTLVQLPAVPVSAHDWQVPVQLVAQQTFCEQKVVAHSAPVVQAVPFGFLVQTPEMQTFGLLQSVSAVHDVLQAVAPQT
jgi:hypothetical protein